MFIDHEEHNGTEANAPGCGSAVVGPVVRSTAKAYGSDLIGVVLSGRLNDGTTGLYEIKRHGGTTMQDPSDAICPAMPASALSLWDIRANASANFHHVSLTCTSRGSCSTF